jgi:pimeloyl-ACP methyl ester carboxylesterase
MDLPQDHFVQIGPFNTRYWVEGSGSMPAILIHGLGGFAESWLANFYEVAAGHRVYALDLPGHGRTSKSLDFSYGIPALAGFLNEFLCTLEIERAALVGHSLGGAVAAQFALLFPQSVEKLALVGSAGLGRELAIGLRLGCLPGVGETFARPERAGIRQSARMLIYDPAQVTDEIVDLLYEMARLPGTQAAYLKTLRANVDWRGQRPCRYTPIFNGLATIRQPALIIWGRQDQIVPVCHAGPAAARLRDGRVEIIEQCGHLPMYEHSAFFNTTLLEFLD